MKNPFIISGYLGPEYFCDREEETSNLVEAAENGRNIVLVSIRRLGKTGLINHSFRIIKDKTGIVTIYMDLMPTTDIISFTNIFAKSVFEQSSKFGIKALSGIKTFLSRITPAITFDSLSGNPSLELKISDVNTANQTLDDVFNFIKKDGRQFHIAIDEFQQITGYPEKNTEALLRSHIQQINNATFIFSGSKKHILEDMFVSGSRPFYNSSGFLHLDYLEKGKYGEFIKDKFIVGKKKLDDSLITSILELTRVHTYYTQYFCNRLYSSGKNEYSQKDIEFTLSAIIKENETIYHNYRNFLTNNQWQLLKAIASDDGVKEPTSAEFIRKYNLKTPSSVSLAIKSLIDKELIFEEKGKFFVSDVFFSIWLKNLR